MNLNIRNKILGLSLLLLTGVSAMASPLTGQVPESEKALNAPWTKGAFETRQYRNVFAEMGYTQEEIDKRVQTVFNGIFSPKNKVYVEPDDSTAYICDIVHNDVRSEGMSYGMMIAVQFDRKDVFDRLWRWSKTYMQHKEGPSEGYFAWCCRTDGSHIDGGSASDGELYFNAHRGTYTTQAAVKKNNRRSERALHHLELWGALAARRGLPNISCMVDAVPALTSDKAVELFGRFNVLTKKELESRAEVEYETYAKAVNIEAKAMLDIAGKDLIPAVMKYIGDLSATVEHMHGVMKLLGEPEDFSDKAEVKRLRDCVSLLNEMQDALEKLEIIRAEVRSIEDLRERAVQMHAKVVPAMDALRAPADKLEMIVDRSYWPMPSYGDLMFEV